MDTPPVTPRRRNGPTLLVFGAVAVAAAVAPPVLNPRGQGAPASHSSDAEPSGTAAPVAGLAAGTHSAASTPEPEDATTATRIAGAVWRDGRPAAARVEIRRVVGIAPRLDPASLRCLEDSLEAPLPAPPPLAAVDTDADGRFSAEIDGPGRFETRAHAADGATGFARLRVKHPGESADVVVHLARAAETLRGRVRLSDGTPFVGLVAARPDATSTRWLEAPAVATDAEGRFALSGLPAGRTTVVAWRPGEITVSRRGIIVPREGEVEILVGEGLSALRGEVVDSRTGRPVAFAAVALDADDRAGDLFRTLTTAGADGRFAILASGPSPTLAVAAEGYARLTLPKVDPSLPCQVRLARHASVSGRVLRESDASPIPGARIEVLSLASDARGEAVASGAADDLGRYRIDRLPPGEFAVVGSTAGWESAQPSDPKTGDWGPLLVALTAGESLEKDLRLHPATALPDEPPAPASGGAAWDATLEVAVVDDETGAPIGGARVWAPSPWSRSGATTDASGRATLAGVDLHAYDGQLGVDAPGHAGERRRLEDVHGPEVTVRLGPGRALSGRVVRKDGTPVPGAEVSLLGEETAGTTAADGTFWLEGVASGTHTVCAVVTDEEGYYLGMAFGRGAPGAEVVVLCDEDEVGIDGPPRLDPAPQGQGVVVHVTDPEGRPVPSAHAALVRWDVSWPAEVRSGRAVWDGVPGAEARVEVWGARDAYGVPLPLGCAIVSLPKEARTVEACLPPQSAVTGTVLGPNGLPVPGVLVIATWPYDAEWLQNDPRAWEAIGSSRTDAAGRFGVSGPAKDQEVALVVVAPADTVAPAGRARGGGDAVEVRLRDAAAKENGPGGAAREATVLSPWPSGLPIRGRLTLPPEAKEVVVTARRGGFVAHGVVSDDGRYEIQGLPPGEWSVRATCGAFGERCEAETTVAAGGTADLFLRAPPHMYE